jgi:hypothetical protein
MVIVLTRLVAFRIYHKKNTYSLIKSRNSTIQKLK